LTSSVAVQRIGERRRDEGLGGQVRDAVGRREVDDAADIERILQVERQDVTRRAVGGRPAAMTVVPARLRASSTDAVRRSRSHR
jgi:hypothetical protein